jgi:ABC-type branched-subunit amino acid transport system ATPase component
VEIAIALAQRPRLLLLDEPTDGVAASELHLILDVICQLDSDVACMIIEHNLEVIFQVANRTTVLVAGAVLMEGSRDELAARLRDAEETLSQFSLAALKTMNQVVGKHMVDGDATATGQVPSLLA